MTCSTSSLQIQHRAAWFNTHTCKLLVEPVVTIYLKMYGGKKKSPVFEAWDIWWRLLKIMLMLRTTKTPENVEERHINIYRPFNVSACSISRSLKEMSSRMGVHTLLDYKELISTFYKICRNSRSPIPSFEGFNRKYVRGTEHQLSSSLNTFGSYLFSHCHEPLEWSTKNWHFLPHTNSHFYRITLHF